MKNLSTVVFLGLLWLGMSASASAAEDGIDFRADICTRKEGGYHTYRIPTMVVTAKGTVLLFFEGRKDGRRDMGNVDQLMKRSEDGGRTWSEQTVLLDEGTGRVGNPSAIVERDGRTVHLLFTRHCGECFFHTASTDEGKTWSKLAASSDVPEQKEYTETNFLKGFGGSPVKIGVGPVHGIHTTKGRLIAACGVSRKPRGGSGVIYSDDGGKTWNAGGVVPYDERFRPGECTVVERSDGSLLLNMRAGGPGTYALGYRVTSTSSDAGLTWSKPVIDKNLPCPACQGSMIRLSDEAILFLNPAVHRSGGFHLWSRKNLTLRLSKDDGRTWPHSRRINQGLAGYTDMAVTKKGKILCVFENGKGDYCEKLSIVQVDPEWLRAGKDLQEEKKPEKK